jgi:excisionase family DNA binding protein
MLLGVLAVAKRLGLSSSRVVQLNRQGRLPAIRDSANRRQFDEDVVDRFMAERSAKAAARRLGITPPAAAADAGEPAA